MLAKFRSAVSKLRVRQREAARRHTQRRTLRAEPLEGRLLMAGDSWVVPTGIQSGDFTRNQVASDSEGSVYLATMRNDGSATSPDAVLTKYLANGDFSWTNDFTFTGGTQIRDVAVGRDGVYIVGGFAGTVNLDPDGGTAGILRSLALGGGNGYLAKYSIADGAFLWAHQWGETLNGGLESVAVLQGDGVSAESVFVTGRREISVKGTKVQDEQWVTCMSSDNVVRWEETARPGPYRPDIAVGRTALGQTNVYISGGGTVAKYIETEDGNDASLTWTYDLGERLSMVEPFIQDIAVGTVDPGQSLYVLFAEEGETRKGLLKISDTGVTGEFVWSTYMIGRSTPWEIGIDGETAYVAGWFLVEQLDLDGNTADNPLLTSRGSNDGFLASYDTEYGRLRAAQRMGGTVWDGLTSMAVGNGYVYAGGPFRSTDGDFPAGRPGEMSAFAGDPHGNMFIMKLNVAAPIVQVLETDISVVPGASAPLTATTSPGSRIAWYDKNGNWLTDPAVDTPTFTPALTQLLPGLNQFSAVATDAEGRTGMAGVVVTVLASTKFYVVDDATANQTFEYSAGSAFNESYSLNTGNTAPRGAASTVTGDKTWVVDANRKVYVYDNQISGRLLGSWTAGTLSTKAKVEGITVYGNDVWIVDAYSDKVYKYAGAAAKLSGTWTASSFSLSTANLNPKDLVTDGTNIWVVEDGTTDKVFKYSMTGSPVGNWTISGGGGAPTGITLDPSVPSGDLWIVDSTTDRVYRYANGRTSLSGTQQIAADAFALATPYGNPQGIADPPAPGSLLTTETPILVEPVSAEPALVGNEAALEGMYYEPLKKVRIDTVQRSTSRAVESHTRDLSYTVGAAPNYLTGDNRWATDHDSQSDVDDLFAEWESDPLELVSLPDLGI